MPQLDFLSLMFQNIVLFCSLVSFYFLLSYVYFPLLLCNLQFRFISLNERKLKIKQALYHYSIFFHVCSLIVKKSAFCIKWKQIITVYVKFSVSYLSILRISKALSQTVLIFCYLFIILNSTLRFFFN